MKKDAVKNKAKYQEYIFHQGPLKTYFLELYQESTT